MEQLEQMIGWSLKLKAKAFIIGELIKEEKRLSYMTQED